MELFGFDRKFTDNSGHPAQVERDFGVGAQFARTGATQTETHQSGQDPPARRCRIASIQFSNIEFK